MLKKQASKAMLSPSTKQKSEYKPFVETYFLCLFKFLLESGENIDYNQGLTVSNLVRYDMRFRWQCIYNAGRSAFDWFNFIATFFVVLIPSRSWSYVHIIKHFKKEYFDDDYLRTTFKFLWINFILSIHDIWIFPMGFLGFISVTRHSRMRREWSSYFGDTICFDKKLSDQQQSKRDWSYVLKYDFQFRKSCILQCVLGIIDLIVLILCLPCLLAIPRAPSYIRCYLLLARFERDMKLYHLLTSITDPFVWFVLLMNLGTALLDFILFPFFVLALITRPFSCYKVLSTLFKERRARHLRMKEENLFYDPKFSESDKSKILYWDTAIRKKILLLSVLGPIELILVSFAIATIWTRPLAWKRCATLLWKRRCAGSTDLKQHKTIYIACGINAVCCIIDAVFTIPITIVDLLLIPFGTIHSLVAFQYMMYVNRKRPNNEQLFSSIDVYDKWFKDNTNKNNGHLTQQQKETNNTFNKKLIMDLLRFDIQFRKYLALTLILAFVDLVIFILTLPAILIPWRIWGYVNIYEYHWESYKTLKYNQLRIDLFNNLFLSFLDILVIPFALLSFIFPTKINIMTRGWWRFLSNWSFCQLIAPSASHYLKTEQMEQHHAPHRVSDGSDDTKTPIQNTDGAAAPFVAGVPLTTDGMMDREQIVVQVVANPAPSAPHIDELVSETPIDIPVMEKVQAIQPTHEHMGTLQNFYADAKDVLPSMDFDAAPDANVIINGPSPAFLAKPSKESRESLTGHTNTLLEGIYQDAIEELDDMREDSDQAAPAPMEPYAIGEPLEDKQDDSELATPEPCAIKEESYDIYEADEKAEMEHGEPQIDLLKVGSTIPYEEMKNDIYPNTSANYEQEIHQQCNAFTWTKCDAKSFTLRSSDYFVNQSKEKRNSDDSLYDMFAVDIYQTPVKLNEIIQFIDLHESVEQNKANQPTILPPLFIVNLMIPAANEFSNGTNIIFYAKLSDKAKHRLSNFIDISNSYRYLNEFINDCDALNLSNSTLHDKDSLINRFKVGARIMNLSESSLGFVLKKMIPKKKGGAFFAEEWAKFYHEPGKYFALDIDIYEISGTSKSALDSARKSLGSIVFDLYFYLGAKQLNETPEQILSCCRLSKIDVHQVPLFPLQRFGIDAPQKKMQSKHNDAYKPKYHGQLWMSLRYDSEFRKFSVSQFFIGLTDLMVLLLSFVSALSIIRLPAYWRSFVLLCDFGDSHCLYNETLSRRWAMSNKGRGYIYYVLLLNVAIAIVDIVVFLPLVLISVLSIVRIPTIFYLFKRHIENEKSLYEQQGIEALMKYNKYIRFEIAKCAMLGILDWCVLIVTLPSVLRFGAWMRCIEILQRLWTSHETKNKKSLDIKTHFIVYKALLLNLPCVILMYITFIMIIINMLLMFRMYHTFKQLKELNEKDEIKYQRNSYMEEGNKINWNKLSAAQLLRWSWSFRKKAIQNILLSLLDILVMVLSLPGLPRLVVCSRRSPRFAAVNDQESDSESDSGSEALRRRRGKQSIVKQRATSLYHWFGWFFIENLDNYKLDKYGYARKALIINTFLTLFDVCIVLPFALPTFILRGRFVLNAFKSQSYKFENKGIPYDFQPGQAMPNKTKSNRSYKTLKVLDYDIELRVFLVMNFFLSIFDLVVALLTIPSVLVPTRTCAYFAVLYKYYWRDQGGHLPQMRRLLFLNLFLAAYDVLNVIPLIYNIILPTRYLHILKALRINIDCSCMTKKRKVSESDEPLQQNNENMELEAPIPTAPIMDDEDEDNFELDQQHDGDGNQQITYSEPQKPQIHAPDRDGDGAQQITYSDASYQPKAKVILEIENTQTQNEGGVNTDDTLQPLANMEAIAPSAPSVDHQEHRETAREEEKEYVDNANNSDDDEDVLNDGETPGLTVPDAQSIPLYDSDDDRGDDEDVGRLNKDDEEMQQYEAQKAELIMEALPGQSEEQFYWRELRYNMEFRSELWRSSYHGTLDDVALIIAFLSIVLSLGLRAKQIGSCTKKYLPQYYENKYSHWRYGCLLNLLYAVWDILCLIGFMITIICFVRIIPLYDQCKYDKSRTVHYGVSRYTNWTKYAWRNALSSPLDLIFFPFAIVVLLSPHIIDMYHEYLSFKAQYIDESQLIVQLGEGVDAKEDERIVLKEGELPRGGQFRITYSSLTIISMFKVRALILRHALHWIFIDILILFPMFMMSFIYWFVIWPTLKYVAMSQWNDFKQMMRGGFLCCLKSLKCCKEKEEKPVHDGPAEIVHALNKSHPHDAPSAPSVPELSDNKEEEEKIPIKRTLENAGTQYYSLTHCIIKMFFDVLRIVIVQLVVFLLKLVLFQLTKIYIQFKRLALNYMRFKLDYDPWRLEEDVYKYAEDEKEFSYWCRHGMSREEANEKQLQQEAMVDGYTERHLSKVRQVYLHWLSLMESDSAKHVQFRSKMPFPQETKARWRLKIQQMDEMMKLMKELDDEDDIKHDHDTVAHKLYDDEMNQISNKYKDQLNTIYVRQQAQKRTSSFYSAHDAPNGDEIWKQVRAEKQQSTTQLALESILEFFLYDLPTFLMALWCMITFVRAYSVLVSLPLIWGFQCGKNKNKNKKQARDLEKMAVNKQKEFLNFDSDQGYQQLAFSTNKENEMKFREIVRKAAKQVFIDILYVPFGILATMSIVRTIPFLKLFFVTYSADDYDKNRASLRRRLCTAECLRAIRDLLCLPLCVIMLVTTPWRLWRIYESIHVRSNHCVQFARKYSHKQIVAFFEGSFNSDQYIKVKRIKTKWNDWGAPALYLILRKYKFEQKKGFNHEFIVKVDDSDDDKQENVSFLQRYWEQKQFDKSKGYAPPMKTNMTLYQFKSDGYLPGKGCAYFLGKHFWRKAFKILGLKTALLLLQKNPMNITYQYFINDTEANNNREFSDFEAEFMNTEVDDEEDGNEEYEEFGMMIKAEIDPIVQRGSCIDVLKEILLDSHQMNEDRSPVIQFQDEGGRILMSLHISAQDVLQSSLNDEYHVRNFDLSIGKIKESIAVHSSYKYYYDKIVSSSSWNTFWWSTLREFIACLWDIPHIILYLFTMLLPWRGIHLTYKLRKHPVYRNQTLARRYIAMVHYSHIFLSRFRELVLVRSANDVMKYSFDDDINDTDLDINDFWSVISDQWRELNDEANKMNESDVPMFLISIRDIIHEAEKHLFRGCAANLSNILHLDQLWQNYLNLQRDKLYYTILRIESNIETYIKHRADEVVRSVILERINKNVKTIDTSLQMELNTIQNISNYLVQDVKIQTERLDVIQQKKCISGYITHKSQAMVHGSIRRQFTKCLMDIVAVFGLLFVLIFHGMELVSHLTQLFGFHWKHRHSPRRPDLRFAIKELIKYHIKYIALDCYYLLKSLLCLAIIIITLVRVEGFMVEVANATVSLHSNRRLTLREFSDICWCNVRYKIWGSLYQLLTLLTILRHWKRALYSIIFSIFIATQGFQGIATLITLNRCCKTCPTSMRAMLQIAMWIAFVIYMFWQLFFVLDDFEVKNNGNWQLTFDGKDAVNDFTLYVIGCTCISMIAQFISDFWLSISDGNDAQEKKKTTLKLWWFDIQKDYISAKISISWPNLLHFVFIIFELIQFTALPIFVLTQVSILKHDANLSDTVSFLAQNSSWNKFYSAMSPFLFIYPASNDPSADFYTLMLLTMIFIFIYVFVIAIPWAFGREKQDTFFGADDETEEASLNEFVQFKKWYYSAWFFARILFVPFLINILKILQCYWILDQDTNHWNGYILSDVSSLNNSDSNKYQCFMDEGFSAKIYPITIILTIGAVFYIYTVLAVMPQLFSRATLVAQDGVDIRFPLAFSGGWQLFSLLYIICIMFLPLVTTNSFLADNATAFGMLLCLIMFIWCFLFECLARKKLNDVDTGYEDIRMCTVPHAATIRRYGILLPLFMCGYIRFLQTLEHQQNTAYWTIIAISIIIAVGLIVCVAYVLVKRRSLHKYRNNFKTSPLYGTLSQLIEKCRVTSDGNDDFLGSWYSEASTTSDWRYAVENAFTLSKAKSVVLQMEHYIVIERLSHKFLRRRTEWRQKVIDCEDYVALEQLLNELTDAIQPVPSYHASLRILIHDCDYLREAPIEISLLLLSFIYDCNTLTTQISQNELKPKSTNRYDLKNTKLSELIAELFRISDGVMYGLLNHIKDDPQDESWNGADEDNDNYDEDDNDDEEENEYEDDNEDEDEKVNVVNTNEEFYRNLFAHYAKDNRDIVLGKDIKALIDSANISNAAKSNIYKKAASSNRLKGQQNKGLNITQFTEMLKMVAIEQKETNPNLAPSAIPKLDYPKLRTIDFELQNYGDLETQMNIIHDSQHRQRCFSIFRDDESLIEWIGANISHNSQHAVALWAAFQQEIKPTEPMDAGRHLAKLLALVVLMSKRQTNFDENELPNLRELEYALGHITCWIIRTKGVPSGAVTQLNKFGYAMLYKLEFTRAVFERNIRDWCKLYCDNEGKVMM